MVSYLTLSSPSLHISHVFLILRHCCRLIVNIIIIFVVLLYLIAPFTLASFSLSCTKNSSVASQILVYSTFFRSAALLSYKWFPWLKLLNLVAFFFASTLLSLVSLPRTPLISFPSSSSPLTMSSLLIVPFLLRDIVHLAICNTQQKEMKVHACGSLSGPSYELLYFLSWLSPLLPVITKINLFGTTFLCT